MIFRKRLTNIKIPSIYAKSKIFDADKKNEHSSYDQKMDVFCYRATNPQYENDYNLINFTPRAHKKTTSKEFI